MCTPTEKRTNVQMFSGAERGSKPRDIALHVVCCMETIYLSLRDTANKMFLNPTPRPLAFLHQLKTVNRCATVTRFAVRQSILNLSLSGLTRQSVRKEFCQLERNDFWMLESDKKDVRNEESYI